MREPMKNIPDIVHIPSSCAERFLSISTADHSPFGSVGLCMGGISTLTGGYDIGRPCAPWHVVLYTLDGAGKLELDNGEMVCLQKDTLLFAPVHSAYRYRSFTEPWCICWFHFRPESPLFSRVEKNVCFKTGRFGEEIVSLSRMHLREEKRQSRHGDRVLMDIERLLVTYIQREFDYLGMPSPTNELRLQKLESLIDGRLSYPWTLDTLAEQIAVSGVYLIQLMKKYRRATPMVFVTMLRMKRVRQLLRTTSWPLKQIAPMVGYANPFALSRAFKRYCTVSPKEYRDTYR